jgi:hypothetical protein
MFDSATGKIAIIAACVLGLLDVVVCNFLLSSFRVGSRRTNSRKMILSLTFITGLPKRWSKSCSVFVHHSTKLALNSFLRTRSTVSRSTLIIGLIYRSEQTIAASMCFWVISSDLAMSIAICNVNFVSASNFLQMMLVFAPITILSLIISPSRLPYAGLSLFLTY